MRVEGEWSSGRGRRRGPHRTAVQRRQMAELVTRHIRAVVRDEGVTPSRARVAEELGILPQEVMSALLWVSKGRVVCRCGREVRSRKPGRTLCLACYRQSPEYLSDEQKRRRGPATVTRIARGTGFALSGVGRRWCPGGHVVDARGFAPETLRAGALAESSECVNCRAGEPVWSSALVWWDDTTAVVRRGPVNTSGPNPGGPNRRSM